MAWQNLLRRKRQEDMLKIQKMVSWVLIEGFHQAKITDARLINSSVSKNEEWELRLIFEATSLLHPTKKYLAKKGYKVKDSKQIIKDLTELLGDDIHQVINLAGEVIPEALNVLVGQPVDIEIEHHHGKNHAEPFCLVSQVTKPGGLIEQLKEAA